MYDRPRRAIPKYGVCSIGASRKTFFRQKTLHRDMAGFGPVYITSILSEGIAGNTRMGKGDEG